MLAKYDYFGEFEKPDLILCNPNNKPIGTLTNIHELKLNPKFNDLSELSFTIYEGGTGGKCQWFDLVEERRQIWIQDLGYFIIDDVNYNENNLDGKIKEVKCYSCEFELNNLSLAYFEGTYKFYDSTNPTTSLLGYLVNRIPKWTIGHIDLTLINTYRTFDVTDQTIYGFIIDDVQSAYNCIFVFDILNREINVYDKAIYLNYTNICISLSDVINDIKISQNKKVYTAFEVFGDNDLDISMVNPIGSNVIYNFSYYMKPEWMSQNLIDRINVWQDEIEANQDDYESILVDLLNKNDDMVVLLSELSSLTSQLNGYEAQKSAILSENGDLSAINASISTVKSQINAKQSQITAKQLEINALDGDRTAINNALSLGSFFAPAEYDELSNYIYQSIYKDENITKSESMTYSEVQSQAKELYTKAESDLQLNAEPIYEYSVDTSGFIFSKEFKHFTEELEAGKLVRLEMDNEIIALILLGFEVDYDSRSLRLEFGNRYEQGNAKSIWEDFQSKISKSTNTINYNKNAWSYPVKSGAVNNFEQYMTNTLDLSKQAIMNAENQTIVLDATGLTGKKIEDGIEVLEQLKLTNNAIVLTSDGWQSADLAVGKIQLPDGTWKYGVIADTLIGKLIIGETVQISGLLRSERTVNPEDPDSDPYSWWDLGGDGTMSIANGALAFSQPSNPRPGDNDNILKIKGEVKTDGAGSPRYYNFDVGLANYYRVIYPGGLEVGAQIRFTNYNGNEVASIRQTYMNDGVNIEGDMPLTFNSMNGYKFLVNGVQYGHTGSRLIGGTNYYFENGMLQ